jgi:TPR repeat protein
MTKSNGMRDDRYVLAIDMGSSSVKATLVSQRGELAGAAIETVDIVLLAGGGAEQDPEQWWSATMAAAKSALTTAAVAPERIVAVACTTQWAVTVPVDEGGLDAVHEYREVLRLQPGYSDAEYNLGRALLAQGKLEQAIDSFSAVLRAQPENVMARHSLGLAFQLQGKDGQAIQEYREVLRLQPDYSDAEFNLGRALLAHGRSSRPSPVSVRSYVFIPRPRMPTTAWAGLSPPRET